MFKQIQIEAELAPGKAPFVSAEQIRLPFELIDEHEIVYRLRVGFDELISGDFLICEPRNHAATGELVVAQIGLGIQVGRFWGKHGLREIRNHLGEPYPGDPTIHAVVTLIARLP